MCPVGAPLLVFPWRGICTSLHLYICTSDRVHIRILYCGSRGWLLGSSHPQARLKEGQPAPVSATAISQWSQELLAALWEAPIGSGSSGTLHQLQSQQLPALIPPLGPADVETLARRGLLLSRLLLLFADVPGVAAAVLKQVCWERGGGRGISAALNIVDNLFVGRRFALGILPLVVKALHNCIADRTWPWACCPHFHTCPVPPPPSLCRFPRLSRKCTAGRTSPRGLSSAPS